MRQFLRDEGGQAVVEYVLSISLAVMIAGVMTAAFRRAVFGLWTTFTKEIKAACPGCPSQ